MLKNEPDYTQLPSYESDLWSLGIFTLELVSKMSVIPFEHLSPSKSIEVKKDYLENVGFGVQ